jgi:site-specific recombinase XerD
MKKQQNPFNIFPRKLKNGTIVYYYYIYDQNGKRKQYSTGKVTEKDAYQECLRLLKLNRLNRHSSLDFEKYCEKWFVYDDCEYIQNKLLHGFSYSRSHAENQRSKLVKHIIPFFYGKQLDNISAYDVECLSKNLKQKGLSNTSVNHNLKTLAIIFNWAERRNEISYNPMKEVLKLKTDTKEKGLFSNDETHKLLFSENVISDIWNGDTGSWLLNLTAYKTGCRLGELQALQKKDIKNGYISVEHSLDRKYGIKSTKTNKIREVPIGQDLENLLKKHIDCIFGEYVFGKEYGRRPIRHDEVYKAYWAAANKIGLSRDMLKLRNITWHSYRHSFSTRMISQGISEPLVRAMTGHSSQKMLDHYTHIGIQELRNTVNL